MRIKDNPLINWLPDNHLMRFLDGREFKVDSTIETLIEAEKYRYDVGSDTVSV